MAGKKCFFLRKEFLSKWELTWFGTHFFRSWKSVSAEFSNFPRWRAWNWSGGGWMFDPLPVQIVVYHGKALDVMWNMFKKKEKEPWKISNMCVCCSERFTQGRWERKKKKMVIPSPPSPPLLSGSLYGCTGAWSDCHISVRKKICQFLQCFTHFFCQKPILEARSTSFVLILLGLMIGSLCLRH